VACPRPASRAAPGPTCERRRSRPERPGLATGPVTAPEATPPGEPLGPPRFPGNAPPPPPAPPTWPPDAGSAPAGPGGGVPPAYPPPGWSPGGAAPFPRSGAEGVPYASWGTRLGGYLIDVVIFLVVLVVLFVLLGHSHTLELHLMARRGALHRRNISALPFLVSGVLWIAYGTLMCGSPRGQTVGMMAVSVRALRDESLAELGYGRALGRALFEGLLRLLNLLFFLLGLLWLLDMLFPLWDRKRQTLHDKVAGSVVLKVTAGG